MNPPSGGRERSAVAGVQFGSGAFWCSPNVPSAIWRRAEIASVSACGYSRQALGWMRCNPRPGSS
jgi:hypothetical protein